VYRERQTGEYSGLVEVQFYGEDGLPRETTADEFAGLMRDHYVCSTKIEVL